MNDKELLSYILSYLELTGSFNDSEQAELLSSAKNILDEYELNGHSITNWASVNKGELIERFISLTIATRYFNDTLRLDSDMIGSYDVGDAYMDIFQTMANYMHEHDLSKLNENDLNLMLGGTKDKNEFNAQKTLLLAMLYSSCFFIENNNESFQFKSPKLLDYFLIKGMEREDLDITSEDAVAITVGNAQPAVASGFEQIVSNVQAVPESIMITKDAVIKQLLQKLGYDHYAFSKDYNNHYAAASYVLEKTFENHDLTAFNKNDVDEFLTTFNSKADLYKIMMEIAKKKTKIRSLKDVTARGDGLVFEDSLKRFDDYIDRAATISFADKQNFIKKDELGRLGYSAEHLNGLKEVFKFCPLMQDDGDRYTWVYPTITQALFVKNGIKEAHREAIGGDDNDVVRNDENGNAYYPAPIPVLKTPKPWDRPNAPAVSTAPTNIPASTEQGTAYRPEVNASVTANSVFPPQPIKSVELSAADAAVAFHAAHGSRFLSDKQRFCIRKTYVNPSWNLEQILQHAMSYDNRSRSVCESLGWLNRDGTVMDTAPDVVKGEVAANLSNFRSV